ncbi:MAG TPA: tRNA uridine-5-carboxymethylaminomethyl(34) synthesis GTPase MnmE [Bacteroidia bacterium]|jgi:tRNA modification GTPase|nr:tRNA uridine-5-carboxymethylaminomethyl(34) synthesis GTPase MnmE [Bacteroidia bacterium]
MRFNKEDTITALATAHGTAAIAVIRLSGPGSFRIAGEVFRNRKNEAPDIASLASHTVHFGTVVEKDIILDEVLMTIFKGPHSYTGQDSIEFSCHGSVFIQQQMISVLVRHGARIASPGEFTMRAFLNGRFDLSQAEAVADLIASQSSASHQVAMQHMRGGFSSRIKTLRENLVNFASLIELELDFSEEDVEFANRDDLKKLLYTIYNLVSRLIDSFEVGNVIKNGIPVAIVGKPNAGKSTLLNAILEEERAIVSEIPGTTRDTIEDEITIDGILFRFIDTAGLRDTTDVIESIGVSRSVEKMKQSSIVIYLFDVHEMSGGDLKLSLEELKKHMHGAELLIVGNKIDKENFGDIQKEFAGFDVLFVSAKEKLYIDDLKTKLVALFDNRTVNVTETIVTNARHVEALRHAGSAVQRIIEGLTNNVSGELLAQDIREALYHLGIITGEITTEDLLENIFSRFCIGK